MRMAMGPWLMMTMTVIFRSYQLQGVRMKVRVIERIPGDTLTQTMGRRSHMAQMMDMRMMVLGTVTAGADDTVSVEVEVAVLQQGEGMEVLEG